MLGSHPDVSDELMLDASVGADDIIYLTVSGRITNAHADEFAKWAERVKMLIREMSKRQSTPVLICSDASGVRHFETKAVSLLRDLLDYDKQYNIKSAMFGAGTTTSMLLDAVIAWTRRTNLKQFAKKGEAIAWLIDTNS